MAWVKCENQRPEEFPDLLATLPQPEIRNYHVCLYGTMQNGFKAELRLPISTPEDAADWIKELEEHTKVTWRVAASGKKSQQIVSARVKYKKYYRCQHRTLSRSATADQRATSKNTNCPAALCVTVKAITKSKQADPHLPELPMLVYIEHNHNHPIEEPSALRHRDVSEETERKLKALFACGHIPPSALRELKSDLQKEHGDNYSVVAADRAICPNISFVYRLHRKWSQELCRPASAKTADITDGTWDQYEDDHDMANSNAAGSFASSSDTAVAEDSFSTDKFQPSASCVSQQPTGIQELRLFGSCESLLTKNHVSKENGRREGVMTFGQTEPVSAQDSYEGHVSNVAIKTEMYVEPVFSHDSDENCASDDQEVLNSKERMGLGWHKPHLTLEVPYRSPHNCAESGMGLHGLTHEPGQNRTSKEAANVKKNCEHPLTHDSCEDLAPKRVKIERNRGPLVTGSPCGNHASEESDIWELLSGIDSFGQDLKDRLVTNPDLYAPAVREFLKTCREIQTDSARLEAFAMFGRHTNCCEPAVGRSDTDSLSTAVSHRKVPVRVKRHAESRQNPLTDSGSSLEKIHGNCPTRPDSGKRKQFCVMELKPL